MVQDNKFKQAITPMDSACAQCVDGALRCAVARAVRARRLRTAWVSAAASLLVIGSFIVGLNSSPAFAMAVGHVPLLRGLAQLLTFDKGLTLAAQNDYFQPIGQSQEKDGLTVNIGGVMADDGQLTVFWDVSGAPADFDFFPKTTLKDASGKDLEYTSYSNSDESADGTHSIQFTTFGTAPLPSSVILDMSFYRSDDITPPNQDGEAPINPADASVQAEDELENPERIFVNTFEFKLDLDATMRRPGVTYPLNKAMNLAPGVSIVLDRLIVYPTQARLLYHADPADTQAINDITFTLTNELGETYKSHVNTPGIYLMESSFFSKAKHLTLHCDNVSFLPKGQTCITIDPTTGQVLGPNARWLIPVSYSRKDGALRLTYTISERLSLDNQSSYDPFTYPITDDHGNVVADSGQSEVLSSDDAPPQYTLLLKDMPIIGMLHIPVGISPPVAVSAEDIKIK